MCVFKIKVRFCVCALCVQMKDTGLCVEIKVRVRVCRYSKSKVNFEFECVNKR